MISNFSSFFEIFTAFNFAYIISNDFNKTLNDRIIGGFTQVEEAISKTENEIEVSKKSIETSFKSGNNNPKFIKDLKLANEALDKKEVEFQELRVNIVEKIKKATYSDAFPYLCFYGALHCLSMLLLIGYQDSTWNDTQFGECFFIYCFFSFVLISLTLYPVNWFRGYIKMIKCFAFNIFYLYFFSFLINIYLNGIALVNLKI